MRKHLLATVLALAACSPADPPVAQAPATRPAAGYVATIAPCADSSRLGLWVGDCDKTWCLPQRDADFFYSVNTMLRYAYAATPLPEYVATLDVTACPDRGGAHRVFRLSRDEEFLGAKRFMLDPVQLCDGWVCDGPVTDQWAVSHPEQVIHIPAELPLSEFLDAYGPR